MKRFLGTFLLLPGLAFGQAWPSQPITVIMGFPAGSGVDVVARMLQEPMEKSLGGRLVMDYRTGAGGNLASEAVAKARPDGYTLLLGTAATHGVNAALYKRCRSTWRRTSRRSPRWWMFRTSSPSIRKSWM